MRTIIFHYHLFKNAGTSLDAALQENFTGDEWVTKEFSGSPRIIREQVRQWILDSPQARCFSSHTAVLPPPIIEGIKVIPAIFVRHPIDRIVSTYEFEKKQSGGVFDSVVARNTDVKGYIEIQLSTPSRQCRNFHLQRFSLMYEDSMTDELSRSIKASDSLPFIGVVEFFAESLKKLETLLRLEGFENMVLLPKEANVTRKIGLTMDEKMNSLKLSIGEELYSSLLSANHDDIVFYDYIVNKFNANS